MTQFFINAKKHITPAESWTWGLLNSVIIGGSTSVVSWMSMAAAKQAGLNVPSLNLKALGVIFVSGAVTKFFLYLSQGLPMLKETTDENYIKTNPSTGVVEAGTRQTVTTTPVQPPVAPSQPKPTMPEFPQQTVK